jgi:hypothetical protein
MLRKQYKDSIRTSLNLAPVLIVETRSFNFAHCFVTHRVHWCHDVRYCEDAVPLLSKVRSLGCALQGASRLCYRRSNHEVPQLQVDRIYELQTLPERGSDSHVHLRAAGVPAITKQLVTKPDQRPQHLQLGPEVLLCGLSALSEIEIPRRRL